MIAPSAQEKDTETLQNIRGTSDHGQWLEAQKTKSVTAFSEEVAPSGQRNFSEAYRKALLRFKDGTADLRELQQIKIGTGISLIKIEPNTYRMGSTIIKIINGNILDQPVQAIVNGPMNGA